MDPNPGAAVSPPPKPDRSRYDAMSADELIDRYERGVMSLDKRLLELGDEALDTAFLPDAGVGRWPCRVVVGHLADAELVQSHRLRRIVAEDGPLLAGWDESGFVDAGLYGPLDGTGGPPVAGFVAVIHTVRKWTGEWLRTLDGGEWERRSLHPRHGELTLRGMLAFTNWHFDHHVWHLNRKIERLAGPGPRD